MTEEEDSPWFYTGCLVFSLIAMIYLIFASTVAETDAAFCSSWGFSGATSTIGSVYCWDAHADTFYWTPAEIGRHARRLYMRQGPGKRWTQ